MPGKHITKQQEILYMSLKQQGYTQVVSSAKAGISERSGRSIEKGQRKEKQARHWRTRPDPLKDVWENELIPLLSNSPTLKPLTLLEWLQEKYPALYPDKILRTLERRVALWKATQGPPKEVMFRQEYSAGGLGLSDFTKLKGIQITIKGVLFEHLLYHFRLAFSGWSDISVVEGGESYTALAEGLQTALWRLGGAPKNHRTDSLSAAFKNLTADAKEDVTKRYECFCQHYHMVATRNNRGKGHENGSIESPHGHLKRRIEQALLLRGSYDFESTGHYQLFLSEVVKKHNQRNAPAFKLEQAQLQSLPAYQAIDFTELHARVSSASTIDVRRVTYTVPSRLIDENLSVHLYHNRLACYVGAAHVVTLQRIYPTGKTTRAKNIDYRHVIHSLVKKPQAFRFSRHRDDLLPGYDYQRIWAHIDKTFQAKPACKMMVGLLALAALENCERALGNAVLFAIEKKKSLSLVAFQARFSKSATRTAEIDVTQHLLASYASLNYQESRVACHGTH